MKKMILLIMIVIVISSVNAEEMSLVNQNLIGTGQPEAFCLAGGEPISNNDADSEQTMGVPAPIEGNNIPLAQTTKKGCCFKDGDFKYRECNSADFGYGANNAWSCDPPENYVHTLALSVDGSVEVGKGKLLRADSVPSPRSLIWTSNNPEIATINNAGLLTGVAPGDTKITVSGGGKTSSNTIRVTSQQQIEKICPSTPGILCVANNRCEKAHTETNTKFTCSGSQTCCEQIKQTEIVTDLLSCIAQDDEGVGQVWCTESGTKCTAESRQGHDSCCKGSLSQKNQLCQKENLNMLANGNCAPGYTSCNIDVDDGCEFKGEVEDCPGEESPIQLAKGDCFDCSTLGSSYYCAEKNGVSCCSKKEECFRDVNGYRCNQGELHTLKITYWQNGGFYQSDLGSPVTPLCVCTGSNDYDTKPACEGECVADSGCKSIQGVAGKCDSLNKCYYFKDEYKCDGEKVERVTQTCSRSIAGEDLSNCKVIGETIMCGGGCIKDSYSSTELQCTGCNEGDTKCNAGKLQYCGKAIGFLWNKWKDDKSCTIGCDDTSGIAQCDVVSTGQLAYTLTGIVTYSDGNTGINGAIVEHKQNDKTYRARTSADGRYTMKVPELIDAWGYEITASYEGKTKTGLA